MEGLLNFSVAFVLAVFAVLVLFGKADGMMARYKLTFKDGKPGFVKYREYDTERTRPLFALILFLLAIFMVLEYVFRPLPEWSALVIMAMIVPMALYMEIKCRKKQ